jgi:DNA-binding protein H-NS
MPISNLNKLSTDELLALRSEVERILADRRREIERELSILSGTLKRRVARKPAHSVKGTKVAPKYRGPSGELWSGRGQRPRWLAPLLRQGKKLDAFRID